MSRETTHPQKRALQVVCGLALAGLLLFAEASSLRTFYFEPKDNTLKITEDATHLLLGITHDGNSGAWEFLGYRLVDLSRLKAEFQASNRDLYKEPSVLEKREAAGKDGGG
jgi:hypothetical protein